MSRPVKLTSELQAKLCSAIAEGNYYETACKHAGIDYSTFRKWILRGEKGKEGDRFFEFCEAIKKAESEAEMKCTQVILKSAAKNWQAAAWWLERRYPARWGREE
ncbi:MAG: hypothetical protein M0Z75_10055 [Nitrospiraceae bacterium]|nr:hypothetical protein [Nitrospiraceae bacterium]